jgi:uncharacterized protein YyaL (SSP411 family)
VLSLLIRGAIAIAAGVALATVLDVRSAEPIAAPPGAAPYPDALQAALQAARAREQGPARTRHRNPDGSPRYSNRLLLEPSPYLQQHAHNPVDWYPWGEEAFARARAEHRPVLLSVGYSTCHWCHVMEEESFEDPTIAEYLNRNYIAIKVDRERRPDIDDLYMAAVEQMSGRGGWPMTVWLTPDRQPFYGGTYFPPHDGDRGQRTGFLTLLRTLRAAYDDRPGEVAAAAADVAAQLRTDEASGDAAALPSRAALDRAVAALRATYDATNGGFGGAPKFPRPAQLELLLRYARRTADARARDMAAHTLDAMAAGGVYDQIGGGFHRYATDVRWEVPHFEKMLYDNALLANAYLDAAAATGRADFAAVTRDILDYVARDMTAPEGGFYSASDADSGGEEGAGFVWTPAELARVLGAGDARLAAAYYGITRDGNFHGASIPHRERTLDTVAAQLGVDPGAAALRLAQIRAALLAARQHRPAPQTDRKIIAAWNGLMISAFARAGARLDTPQYVDRAARAAEYVLGPMRRDGRLRRSAFAGQANGDAYLDDYACVIAGLLDLYEATGDVRWLRSAADLARVADAHYADPAGGYFLAADDTEPLLARQKPAYDGAEPAGNSIMALDLLRLAELTGDDRARARAEATLRAFAPTLGRDPLAMPALLHALDFALDRAKEIVIVAPHDRGEAQPFLDRLHAAFTPNRVVVVAIGADASALAATIPIAADKTARAGKPTAYVCEQRVCALPTSDPAVFAQQLGRVEPLPHP